MTVTPPVPKTQDHSVDRELLPDERRRHLRAHLPAEAALLLPGGDEVSARLVDISAGGAKLACDAPPPVGDRVVLYAAGLGRLEASVVRTTEDGMAIAFSRKAGSVTRLADALTWALNAPDRSERRTAKRYKSDEPVTVVLPDGAALPCRVLDASPEGASLELSLPVALGDLIEVGRMKARIVRQHEAGIGVTYLYPARSG